MAHRDFTGLVTNGRLPRHVEGAIDAATRLCEGKWLVVTLQVKKKRRSLSQNRFYFGVVVPLVSELFREAGDPMDEEGAHDFLMREVGKFTYRSKLTGQVMRRSSRDLNTEQWEAYMEAIRAWAAQMGLSVPLPGEQL